MHETYHKVDLGNFAEIKSEVIEVLGNTDFLHIKSLQQELGGHISRGQLMCALDSMEREGLVSLRKAKQDIYVSLT